MTNISKWFGYPIYISQIQNYEEINKEILPILKKDIIATNSQYARTTDIKAKDLQSIDDNLHLDERFDKLFNEITQTIIAAFMGNITILNCSKYILLNHGLLIQIRINLFHFIDI